MKSSAFFFLLFSSITLQSAFAISPKESSWTISEGVKQKLISITVRSYDGSKDSVFNPSYYGPCIVFDIRNLKANTIELTEDAGRFLMPDDTDEQRMILTSRLTLALSAHQQKSVLVYAMCTEAHDAGPSIETKFSYGTVAEGNLLALVQMIAKNNFQDNTAQYAVWCITDNYSPYNMYSKDTAEASKLGKFVCTLKHIPYKPGAEAADVHLPHSAHVTGDFRYTIERTHTIDLRIYNSQNQLVKDVVHGEKQGPGTYTYRYDVDIPVNDDRNPPSIVVKFYFDGKIISEKKHVLQNY